MQDLTDASGRKAAADILAALLRSPETFGCGTSGGSDMRWGEALAELTAKVWDLGPHLIGYRVQEVGVPQLMI